jgi:hypothetical protein
MAWRRPLQHGLKEVLEHACQCSECFLDHQHQKARFQRYRLVQGVLFSVAAVILVAVGLAFWFRHEYLSPRGSPDQEIVMDLSPTRSRDPQTASGRQVLSIPRKKLTLRIVLPAGNEEGHYEVQLARGRTSPWVTASGRAIMEAGQLLLKVKMDCSLLPAGNYSVGIREPGWEWTEFPAEVQ